MDIAVGASRRPSTSPSADIKTAQSAVRQGRLLTRTRTGDCADHYVGPLVTARKKAGDVGESGPHSPLCGRGVRKWSAQSPVRQGLLLTRTRTVDCADHYVRPLVTARKNAGDVGENGPHQRCSVLVMAGNRPEHLTKKTKLSSVFDSTRNVPKMYLPV